eukprot:tig00021168_g19119.t2
MPGEEGAYTDIEDEGGEEVGAVDRGWVVGLLLRLIGKRPQGSEEAEAPAPEQPPERERSDADAYDEDEEPPGPDKDRIEAACALWDLCANPDLSVFLMRNRIFDVIAGILSAPDEHSERLLEVSSGVLGNMALVPEVAETLSGSGREPLASASLRLFLTYGDARTLVELCRFFAVLTSSEASRERWCAEFDAEQPVARVLWIAENALLPDLLERDLGLLLNLLFYGAGRRSLTERLLFGGVMPVLADLAASQAAGRFCAAVCDALLRVLEVVTSEGGTLLPALLRARRADGRGHVVSDLQRSLARIAWERAEEAPDTAGAACGVLQALEDVREETDADGEAARPEARGRAALAPLPDLLAEAPNALCDLLATTDEQNLPGVLSCLYALARAAGPPLEHLARRAEELEAALRRAWDRAGASGPASGSSSESRFEEDPSAAEHLRALCAATARLLAARFREAGHPAAASAMDAALRSMPGAPAAPAA